MFEMPKVDLDHFHTFGYVLIKQVFSEGEMHVLRHKLQAQKQAELASQNYQLDPAHPKLLLILGDVLSKDELRDMDYVLFDERILGCVRQILGKDLVYFGDSSMQSGEGFRGFHKDNVDRTDGAAPDWQSEYNLIRIGVYVQDHSRHSGGLKVRLKSHRYPFKHRGRAVNVSSELGDVLVWNLRLTHSGNYVRLRGLPNVCLHPRVEQIVPHRLRIGEQQERLSIFGTFAAPGDHLERYLAFIAGRNDYRPHFLRGGFNRALLEWVGAKGVQFRRPISEYGSLYAHYGEV